jgi:hypothetical protein
MVFLFMIALFYESGLVHGVVLVAAFAPVVPVIGETLGVGTAAQEVTPRLPISVESSGIPLRAPGVVDDAEVGLDDEATVLEPEPHIPDKPAVVVIPEIADTPEVADILDAARMADVAGAGDAVAGGAVPFSVTPPPS